MPEIDKLLILGKIFHVSVDVLIKEDLLLNGIIEVPGCSANAVKDKQQEIFEGILIKESVTDENIIDYLNIHKIELWNTGGKPKYWTVLYFTSNRNDLPELLSKVMVSVQDSDDNWFVDFKREMKNILYLRKKY